MDLEPTQENISEAFGFQVPPSLAMLVGLARRLRPEEPHRALEAIGIELGGPLFGFLGGQPTSMREPHTPPELFPFLYQPAWQLHIGYVVDEPETACGDEFMLAGLSVEAPEKCGMLARNLPELLSALVHDAGEAAETVATTLCADFELGDCGGLDKARAAAKKERDACSSYCTDDRIGVRVPEEPAPLELLHVEFRRHLIGTRERDRVLDAGRRALKIGAPGAALALARDLIWTLGERTHWYQIALELMEEVYPALHRPLLARVARREWARHYGRRKS
ncbi:MAG: hypothetical protein HY319_23955 [Armatimonadetes bacterium]|nr:hypothetical protein [Armatimonadota bacterium]